MIYRILAAIGIFAAALLLNLAANAAVTKDNFATSMIGWVGIFILVKIVDWLSRYVLWGETSP